jgi:benzoyl-CoA reductase/2-hydroxyglutaryl-CoA dehydratase subunit BcrC/BadD/HgdB
MNGVAYCHPFVPPEWIAAHGLRPCWLPCRAGDEPAAWVRRGVCPVAAARLDDFAAELPADAVVLTTTCDQIRYAAALLQHLGRLPVFLMHVPRTWQTAAARAFYREELGRLGRFLVGCGGTAPDDDALSRTMLQYDQARASLRRRSEEMPAGAFAEAVAAVRGDLVLAAPPACGLQQCRDVGQVANLPETWQIGNLPHMGSCLPLALVGGPMSQGDYEMLTAVEEAGGRFVLDATEAGERTLPAPLDADRLKAEPREELARVYFDCIPDVFQRPNDRLYAWLRQEVAGRRVRGILARRYVWCDHWHGEMPRLREQLSVPVLEWDGAGNDPRSRANTVGRMEAFLEMLR